MVQRTHRTRSWGVAAALFVTFLWSSSWVIIRWGLDDESLPPLMFAALRYGTAAVLLLVWTLSKRKHRAAIRNLDRRSFAHIATLGIVFYAVTQGAQFVAIDNQPAATTSLVFAWTPLLVAGFGSRLIDEAATARQLAGTLLVVLGAWLYFSGGLGATVVGMAAAVVGLAANVASSLLGRDINRSGTIEPAVVTAVSMAIGAGALVLVGLEVEGLPEVSVRAWALILWLAVVNTALAFTLWNYSLRHLSALESSAINNTMLVQIALLAWIFLDEALGLGEIVGIVLVSGGIVLSQASRTRRN